MERKYDEQYVGTEYSKGRTTVSIAKELGTYNTTIRRILIRNGITPRGSAEVQDSLQGNNPFLENSEHANYFLGYIAADGNLADKNWKHFKYSIRLNTCTDPQILDSYKQWANIPTKTQHKKHKVYGTDEYCVEFCSKNCWEYLTKIGITSNKSLTLMYHRKITYDFIRGVLDGDGNIYVEKDTLIRFRLFTSSPVFAGQLYEFLKIDYTPTISKYNSIYTVSVCKQSECESLYHNLYDNATIFLQRKKDKMARFFEKS